jgi:magnesium-transporting ATPase (P-type)
MLETPLPETPRHSPGAKPPPEPDREAPQPGSFNWSALIKWVSIGIVSIVVIVFIIGLVLAFTNPTINAQRLQVIREIMTTILLLLSIIILSAFALFLLQIIRLISTIRHESKSILDTTRETVTQAKGGVEFVGQQVSEPLITLGAWGAGLAILIRDLGGIRRAIQHRDSPPTPHEDADATHSP